MADIGTMKVTLLAKVGDGEAFEIGDLELELSGHVSLKGWYASAEVHTSSLVSSLADALEDGAKQLRDRT